MMRSRRGRGFTLLEIIVALGVLAIGATAAFALLVAAAAAGKRAEHHVNAALIAETILNDTVIEEGMQIDGFPLVSETDPPPGAAARGTPHPEARYLELNGTWKSEYPDYRYDIIITPQPGPQASETWAYLVEVEVRWSEKGRRRSAVFSTVKLKKLSPRNNPTQSSSRP